MCFRIVIATIAAFIAVISGCGESESAKQARAEAMLKEIDAKNAADYKAMQDAINNIDTGKKKQPSKFDNIK